MDTIAEMSVKVTLEDKASDGLDKVSTKLDKSAASSKTFSDKIGGAATSLAAVGTQVDRAMNLMDRYEITQLTVANANLQVERAQDTLNRAIAQYGVNSTQAATASKSLATAQNSLTAANIRADSSMVMIGISAASMVPNFLTGAKAALTFAASGTVIASASGVITTALGAISAGLSSLYAVFLANPIGVIIVALIAGIMALRYAYENNILGIKTAIDGLIGKVRAWASEHETASTGIKEGLLAIMPVMRAYEWVTGDATKKTEEFGGTAQAAASGPVPALTSATQYAGAAMNGYGLEAGYASQKSAELSTAQQALYIKMRESGASAFQAEEAIKYLGDGILDTASKAPALVSALGSVSSAAGSMASAVSSAVGKSLAETNALLAGLAKLNGSSGSLLDGAKQDLTGFVYLGTQRGTKYYAHSTEPGGDQTVYAKGYGYSQDKDAVLKLIKESGTPAFAGGGSFITNGPTPIITGEGGERELVRVTPLSKMGGGSGGLIINFNAPIYGVNDLQNAIDSALNRVKWNVGRLGGL